MESTVVHKYIKHGIFTQKTGIYASSAKRTSYFEFFDYFRARCFLEQ